MNCSTILSLVLSLVQLGHCYPTTQNFSAQNTDQSYTTIQRVKRGWVWEPLFVTEEQTSTMPTYVGQLKSDLDKEDGSLQYILTGEGADSIFFINEHGKIYVRQKLDREKKSFYILRAQVINRKTRIPIEPDSEFIIKVRDINDHEPQFLDGPYVATVPEMSPEGTSVTQVTATDGDDPSYGNNARLLYSLIQGQPYFSVEPKTGVIRMASQMDRETKDQYLVIIQAKDMVGQAGAFSATATVTINLSDVNDNPPKFQQRLYYLNVSEEAPVGTTVGRLLAEDSDVGENAAMNYFIEEDSSDAFGIITDRDTQEGVIILKKRVDYESKRKHSVRVKAVNRYIDDRFLKEGPFEDITIVQISVVDADEAPVFTLESYVMEIAEGAENGSLVGIVSARDLDKDDSPVRYSIVQGVHLKRLFSINEHNGTIITTEPLDREKASWHNITVTATETRNPEKISEANVYIQVLDVNDHAPEFPKYYETYVCENAIPGQLIQSISAVDKDDSAESHQFYFSLAQEATNNSHFTVKDNQDNTAGIFTAVSGFSRQEQFYFFLPILILDNGSPPLTSTNTLTVTVCDCDTEVNMLYCRYGAFLYSIGLSTEALVAVLACLLILLVFFLAIIGIRQQRKKTLFSEKVEEFRENIVRYDDEGGGEEDTEAFDISALRTRTVLRTHKPRKKINTEIHSLYRQSLQVGPDSAIFRQFISEKLEEANTDPSAPPYDSLQTYAFEGTGSLAGSLSSLGSNTSDMDQNYDYLVGWGPHFKQLASMYASQRNTVD
ncbi:cadherin-19 isoform X1 [Coturnix japonica]|uniref:cadherin-19 isoform X1 n=1 Tax=Coturnix japonica TaxID=93934 RepID=UPI000777DCAA|nr:cadherin-19 isoform X1 [Coturnix japonica]XP_015710685.1 cadherin-19 isoform X1 [Coturnix japonica]XP_015710686.1 cadherin-19 isoform X1 [Coturnix japonica]XP_015710687.1 cadherin-19 isoform X1 [Coturnix japonica]XP_015710688.1 cadherin-19 isoform X1 [Coturnix japonica]